MKHLFRYMAIAGAAAFAGWFIQVASAAATTAISGHHPELPGQIASLIARSPSYVMTLFILAVPGALIAPLRNLRSRAAVIRFVIAGLLLAAAPMVLGAIIHASPFGMLVGVASAAFGLWIARLLSDRTHPVIAVFEDAPIVPSDMPTRATFGLRAS